MPPELEKMFLIMKVGETPVTVPGWVLLGVLLLVFIGANLMRPDSISVRIKKDDD